MFYDRPTNEWYDSEADGALIKLFGNAAPVGANSSTWLFWARRPEILENFVHNADFSNDYSVRTTSVVFIGNIENSIQNQYRNYDWKVAVDDFHLTKGTYHRFSQEEYLARLSRARFGLCLRGYGPKCNREIELMALGVVPLVTEGCDLANYAESPIEGVHYLRVKSPKHMRDLVSNITESRWKTMSAAGQIWWSRNCSAAGSFKTTLDQIFKIK